MRLQKILSRIDQLNQQDPNTTGDGSKCVPNELLYSQRMTLLLQLYSNGSPSELLSIACRAQHIQRWTISRQEYPKGRSGYLDWRKNLKLFHAQTTAKLMQESGYDADQISQVEDMLLKRGIKTNQEVQAVEDVACLVFIKYYFGPFVLKFEQEKLFSIIQKTWAKMSQHGQQLALEITEEIPQTSADLIKRALS